MRPGLLALSAVCLLAVPAIAQPPMPMPHGAVPPGPEVPLPTTMLADSPQVAAPGAPDFNAALSADFPTGPRFWASVDYLRWWVTPMNSPDLIQTVPGQVASDSVTNGTILPAGAATRYFPDRRQAHFGAFNGLRGTVGGVTDWGGFDVNGFYLASNTISGELRNNGMPYAIAQQYFSTVNNLDTSLFSSLAGAYVGGTQASITSQTWGLDANVRIPSYRMLADFNHFLVGVRYFDLQESLEVGSNITFPDSSTSFNHDSISTRNQFYGAQVGFASRYGGFEQGLGLDGTIKFALGDMRQSADLKGSNGFTLADGTRDTAQGGLYVQPSNAGVHERNKVAFLTEYDLNLTYNFNPNFQVYFGYSIIYVSSVMRPGEAIDPVLNDSRIRYIATNGTSTSDHPQFTWNANDFWTQGINFGMRFMY